MVTGVLRADTWRNRSPLRWGRTHPEVIDWVIACVVLAYSLFAHFAFDQAAGIEFRQPSWWTVPLIAVATLPLAFRRSHAVAVTMIVVAAQVTLELSTVNSTGWVNLMVALYSLGAYAEGPVRARTALGAAVTLVALLVLGVINADVELSGLEAVGAAAVLVVAFVIGDNVQRRRTEVRDLSERADRAERERELIAGQRVSEERGRIARDLHDVVAHSVSVMVIQAAAARRNLDRDLPAAAQLLENVEATGRHAMGELRQILGVLREHSDVPPTTAVLTDIDSLVRSIPDVDVHLHTTGSLAEVPAGVALSAYRVVQEALTNVHRHGGPDVTVRVDVDCAPDRVNISVADDGRGASTTANRGDSGGYGLVGMAERVAAFGGELRYGPRRSGGWEVRAYFPLHPQSSSTRPDPV